MANPKVPIDKKFEIMWEMYELRKTGLSLRAIGKKMGVCHETVRKYLQDAGRAILLPGVEEYRKLEDERLDAMLEALMPTISKGEPRAIEVGIKLLERRAKLHGLDKPIEYNITTQEISEYDRELAELAREAMTRRHYGHAEATESRLD